MSNGFVMIVVVKPPKAPAAHWISKCDAFDGKMFIKLSATKKQIVSFFS